MRRGKWKEVLQEMLQDLEVIKLVPPPMEVSSIVRIFFFSSEVILKKCNKRKGALRKTGKAKSISERKYREGAGFLSYFFDLCGEEENKGRNAKSVILFSKDKKRKREAPFFFVFPFLLHFEAIFFPFLSFKEFGAKVNGGKNTFQ